MAQKPIRIALIDDQQMWLEALTALLSGMSEVEVAGVATGGRAGLELCLREKPDQVLLDLRMPDMDGLEVLERLLDRQPEARVVFLTAHDDPFFIQEGLAKGVKGYVLKGSSKEYLARAFQEVQAGHYFFDPPILARLVSLLVERPEAILKNNEGCPLTTREREVLSLIAEGKTTAGIADMLCIAVNTVDSHRKNIFSKLDVKNAVEAANKGRNLNCI
ncbi:MAG: response regulator transcription factor [Phaeodactylibacter sp.]|nr:response regulator transcription factor [Phaeodactylibacter sp.]